MLNTTGTIFLCTCTASYKGSRALPWIGMSDGDRSDRHQCQRFAQRRRWVAIWHVGSILHLFLGTDRPCPAYFRAILASITRLWKSSWIWSQSELPFVLATQLQCSQARSVAFSAIRIGPEFCRSQRFCQRKFRSFNFRLYWKLPLGLAAPMLDSRDVLQHKCETGEIWAGRNCEMLCFSIVSWLRRVAKAGPKSEVVRKIGCARCRQNWHHACARERFGSQNR